MVLALSNSLTNWGRSPVFASRAVAAGADAVSTAVADAACQSSLVAGISPRLRPSARREASPNPRFAHAAVRLGRRDVLWITWIVTPRDGATEVDLIAQLESRSALARIAMLLGGRRWLAGRLERTLDVLAALARRAADDLGDVERDAAVARIANAGVALKRPRAA